MKSVFSPSVIRKISAVLGVPGKFSANNHRFEINTTPERRLVVELYPDIPIGERTGNLVSIYTSNTHFQLHFCSGCVVSAMLGEVTFIAEHDGKVSGIIVEREGGCSFYANVDRSLLSGDFTKLGPEVMLSGIALSLTETVLEEIPPAPKKNAAAPVTAPKNVRKRANKRVSSPRGRR
ncbi:MAG: hypothetical protein ACM3Q4_01830 [Acidobacteriota bacterium]